MSQEFFNIMEEIEKTAKEIKFLENGHPEIWNAHQYAADKIKNELKGLKTDITIALGEIHIKKPKIALKKKKNATKSKS